MKSITVLLVPLLICEYILSASSLSFTLSSGNRKCLKEEVHKDVLVTGEFTLSDAPQQKTNLKVTDSTGHVFYKRDDATKGKFAFTTDDYDMYEVCFDSETSHGGGSDREVSINIKHGVEAKNYEDLAKAEKLKPMEVELKRLEDLGDAIVNDFAYMRQREQEMRDTNESTHSRVLYFSIFSILCLFGLATWQLFYLRRFFIAKKLIE
ncbi:predicted protein [Nematostella vectensis]|uniref:GOLD domain-containing protein n=1 Tax=Nematostella vectensis TaxID=45351 RepID=A7S4Z3_NEMVE|nr:transmembrane emp24 domain-containing protein 10 [Nematostella vectensis]EDO41239.1 predicted protein [Nematostella vectensis]|eukprot:XP_001633302.1 predicted protein [Nematostella vectensis]